MPRPNIDIPKYITGGIDDYAKEHDLTRNEAYEAILLRGLNSANQSGFTSIESELEKIEGDDSDGHE